MAFKNIFSSSYAIVENMNYNGPRKSLSFDLVLYRDSSKEFETGRMQYHVNGNMTTFEIDSVITEVPTGLEHEAMPADFDFDVFATFKPYLVGNNPTSDEFTEAGCGELKTGFQYICEIPPSADDDGNWPSTPTDKKEQLTNPEYTPNDPKTLNEFLGSGEVIMFNEQEITGELDGTTPNPLHQSEFIDGPQIIEWNKIKYDWGCLARSTDYTFIDKDGDYWIVTGDTGSINVSKIDKPFLDTDWDTWFSATAMDKLNKNISERVYSWLKTKPEYTDAVSI
jgi:hypothetical protein